MSESACAQTAEQSRVKGALSAFPARRPVPDESRANLCITLDGTTTGIWEWYNDLQKNQRIFRVRELMKKIAWR